MLYATCSNNCSVQRSIMLTQQRYMHCSVIIVDCTEELTCTSAKCKSERFAHWPLRSLHSFLLASIVLGILQSNCTTVNTAQYCHKLDLMYPPDLRSRPSLQCGIPGQLGEEPLFEQLVGCRLVLHDVLFVGLHRFVILFCDMLFCELV